MEIIPSILEQDWDHIVRKVSLVAPYVDWVQIDFSNATLVPTQTFFDIPTFKELIQKYDQHDNGHPMHFEAHLMVTSPEKYVRQLAQAGFERIIAQVEAADPRLFLEETKLESVEAGLAMDSGTEVSELEPFLEELDVVLVMMAEAGGKGPLQIENIEKVRALRQHFPDLSIEAEDGITPQTAKLLVTAGATRLVPTSFIFKNTDPATVASAIEHLKQG